MSDDEEKVSLPFGIPFVGGSEDPSEAVGCDAEDEGGEGSTENSDPRI